MQHGGVKPFASEAHRWIDNVAYDMQVDPLVPKPRFTNSGHMDFSSSPQLPQVIQYHEPQVLQYQEPQALTYESKIPAVEMDQAAPSLPDPKYLLWGQEEREAPKYLVTYKKPVLRSPDVEMEALPAPKYLLWGREEREYPKHLVTYRNPELRSPDLEIEPLPAPKEPIYPLTIPTVNEYSSFLCTLCNTYFKTRKGLERHNKNIHDAYQQKKKGIKRRMEKEDKYPKKYVKWN